MLISRGKITVIAVLLSTFGLGMFLVVASAVDDALNDDHSLQVEVGTPPEISAKAYLVLDIESNTEVVSKNSMEVLPIASITKLFAASAFSGETQLVGTTTVTWGDVNTEGRAGKLKAGEVYLYRELVQAMLVESSNDAASSVQRVDPDVTNRMNKFAKDLNFSNTNFVDASGLSDKNVSTAFELAELTSKVWQTEQYLIDVTSMPQIIGEHTGWVNNSPFIKENGYLGGKHGFTNAAKYTAAAVFEEEISGENRTFVYVVLGSEDLSIDIRQLRAYVSKQVRLE